MQHRHFGIWKKEAQNSLEIENDAWVQPVIPVELRPPHLFCYRTQPQYTLRTKKVCWNLVFVLCTNTVLYSKIDSFPQKVIIEKNIDNNRTSTILHSSAFLKLSRIWKINNTYWSCLLYFTKSCYPINIHICNVIFTSCLWKCILISEICWLQKKECTCRPNSWYGESSVVSCILMTDHYFLIMENQPDVGRTPCLSREARTRDLCSLSSH